MMVPDDSEVRTVDRLQSRDDAGAIALAELLVELGNGANR
jgi:hypothetical protein